jgi:hypothetical protein
MDRCFRIDAIVSNASLTSVAIVSLTFARVRELAHRRRRARAIRPISPDIAGRIRFAVRRTLASSNF